MDNERTPPSNNPDPAPQLPPTGQDISRRQFVQRAAGAVAASAGARLLFSPTAVLGGAAQQAALPGHGRPNIIIIITDQERSPQYWPAGWSDANLPNRKRLADKGLTFTNSFCNTAMCSPSRATLFTGLYPTQHRVEHTLTTDGTLSPNEPTLDVSTQNMARMLSSAGYNVQYRGKWHLTKDVTVSTDASAADDLEKFGFHGWQPPDGGQDTNPVHFGGGCAGYDARWADQAAQFLQSKAALTGGPFALIASFVNPHDTLSYANSWNETMGNAQLGFCDNYADQAPGCFQQGISLPPTLSENLLQNFKPTCQAETLAMLAAGLGLLADGTGPLNSTDEQTNYVNFYAYLHKVVDQNIGTVLDALEANHTLYNNTVVIRVSDHGEMGLSHGGLRQKLFTAYEETIRVPIVISNPKYFPQPVQTSALATLVDLMPTLATIANVPNRDQWDFKGNDLTPIIADAIKNPTNPTATVQDSVLFMFDDDNAGAANGQSFVHEPNHIRCVRDQQYKYSVYFDPCGNASSQYELYDLVNDPMELNNMANPNNTQGYNPALVSLMQAKLDSKMTATGVTFIPNSPYCPTS